MSILCSRQSVTSVCLPLNYTLFNSLKCWSVEGKVWWQNVAQMHFQTARIWISDGWFRRGKRDLHHYCGAARVSWTGIGFPPFCGRSNSQPGVVKTMDKVKRGDVSSTESFTSELLGDVSWVDRCEERGGILSCWWLLGLFMEMWQN